MHLTCLFNFVDFVIMDYDLMLKRAAVFELQGMGLASTQQVTEGRKMGLFLFGWG